MQNLTQRSNLSASPSKMRYSFSKAKRFNDYKETIVRNIIHIPEQNTLRAISSTSFTTSNRKSIVPSHHMDNPGPG